MHELWRQRLTGWIKTAAGSDDAIPKDKAGRARWAMRVLRGFTEETCNTLSMTTEERKVLDAALNALGDRCATADALECKRGKS